MDSGTKGKSLFNVGKNKVLTLVDEAWLMRGKSYLNRGNDVYEIPMGRIVGTKGETTIRIITKHGTNDIISAYPIK
ncbi:hypothetical protein [Caloranaerobacter sp. DY30410]|uniref:hypothetical protein n=1 Tax=Caloranaerobacter sp. DY30410 TaxID=3238305 RepID=UPI003D082ABB